MEEPLLVPDQPTLRSPPPTKRSPLGGIGAGIVAILAKFKYALVFLKTGGTMLLSLWFYALFFGWKYALGFVLLIFIHECGHLVLARRFGLKVGAPVFIPFMGATIALKQAPRNAWMEAWVGIGGPIFGTVGALICVGIFMLTGAPLFLALAYSGFWLNLFNLLPFPPLDGGRITGAISPWLWVAGIAIMAAYLVYQALYATNHFNLWILIIVIFGLPRVWRTLTKRGRRDSAYFELTAGQRVTISLLYFGLIGLLAVGMYETHYEVRPPTQVTL